MGAKRGKKPGPGKPRRSAGLQRFALVLFALVFVALFAGFAIAQGIGEPSVPDGDAAIVQGVSEGSISEAEVKRGVLQQALGGGLKKAPARGSKKFEELQNTAIGELLNAIWIRGEAEEMGISATDKQIATELAQIKKTNFKTEAAFKEFLKTSHFTREDVNERVRIQILSTQIQEVITKGAPPPSESEIAAFYDSSKATQFTTKPTRDLRLVVTKNKKQAEAAKAELDKDHSAQGWKVVAGKLSKEPANQSNGGLQPGVAEEFLQEPLKAAVFKSPQGVVVGPVEFEKSFYVLEVEKLNPEKVQTLDEVKAQIKSQLTQQVSQEYFSEFVSGFQSKWEARSICAAGFVIERCANYVGNGHSSSAPPGCYESDPKGGLPEACPAPVTANSPALPGSVTLLKRQGERLPQRPTTGSSKAAGAEAPLPEGAVPPGAEGEAPPPAEGESPSGE